LATAHAHNDYEHARPLWDALDRGFSSVEADVFEVDGRLLVAHDRVDIRSHRTLESLYLDPLQKRARARGGHIHRPGLPFYLLVDFKTKADATYPAMKEILQPYHDILSEFGPDGWVTRAVTVVISGSDRPVDALAAEPRRWCFIDGRKSDLDDNARPAALIPWISEDWDNVFTWNGKGTPPAAELEAWRAWIKKAHAQGRLVRFWDTPETPLFWRTAHELGQDFINTDELDALRATLLPLQTIPGQP